MRTSTIRCVLMMLALLPAYEGARILGIFVFPSRSHKIICTPLLRELATRGHQVTVLSPFPEKQPHPNITDILIEESDYYKHFRPKSLFEVRGAYKYLVSHWEMGISMTDYLLDDPKVKELIQAHDRQFDLIINEAFFHEAFLGFAHKFQAPIVQISTIDGGSWMGDWVGSTAPYSYVPNNYLPFTDRMTFWQRFVNAIIGTFILVVRQHCYLPQQDEIMKKHFGLSTPPLEALEANTSLLLLNQHFSLSGPKPLLPNMVPIAGINIPQPRHLTQELQTFMDEAPDGVIFFSMGTNLKSSELPDSVREAFLSSFSKLKQRVLWKLDVETLPNLPENVKLSKFLPQLDLLSHANMRLFITHCGVSSASEAAYTGVPVVGIPIFGDQRHNCASHVRAGTGVVLEYDDITADSVSRALDEVLQPRYRENAQRLSRIFRDQPLSPLEQAVFWTEYVIRHRGAPHMRSAALDLAWHQYFLLDVIAVLVLVVTSVLLILFLILRALFRILCGGRKSENLSKKKRN